MSKTRKRRPKPKVKAEPLLISPTSIKYSDLTDDQKTAADMIDGWYTSRKKKDKPILRIGGQAGSGKSFLIKYLVERYGFDTSSCYVIAYTGQAVNRLRKDGVMARTIHSTIMYTVDEQVIDEKGKPIYRRGVPLMRVTFKPVKRLPNAVRLVIVDEASFLPESLEKVLKNYNVPIIEIGDPLQLPPVAGAQCFNENNLDFMMSQVMRQHMDSELYDFIGRLRYRKNVDTHQYHNEVLFLHQQETIEETFHRFLPFFKSADIVITATNKQRQVISDLYRREILHARSPYPMEGEKMICRQNEPQLMIDQYMLANGMKGRCMHDVGRSLVDQRADIYYMDFQPDVTAELKTAGSKAFTNLSCDSERLMAPFGSIKMDLKYPHPGSKMEYAHAITVHLDQGDQHDTVLFVDSYSRDFDYLMRLRYTAASRAVKRLIYLIPYSKYGYPFDLANIEERMRRTDAEIEQRNRERQARIAQMTNTDLPTITEPGHFDLPT